MTSLKLLNQCLQMQKLRCSAALGAAIGARRKLKSRHVQLKYLQALQTKQLLSYQPEHIQPNNRDEIQARIEQEKQLISAYLSDFHNKIRNLSDEKKKLANLEKEIEAALPNHSAQLASKSKNTVVQA